MFKFDLSDFTSIGSQLTDVLAKAGADIEHAADNALGTKMPGELNNALPRPFKDDSLISLS